MPNFAIKSHLSETILFKGNFATIRTCVEAAYRAKANLIGANLSEANLSGANLRWANLSEADLSGADLSGADLSGANLTRADLCWANLSGADLSGADLCRANLYRANLSGADLSRADLYRVDLSGADLSGVKIRKGVILNSILRRAERADGYTFYLLDTSVGVRIMAGCRWFTFQKAWDHWCGPNAYRRGTDLGKESQDILVMFSLEMDRKGLSG